jgi:UDP-GlcNAc:undecaprenyl-phosphate GlcNAc-1-phosphate transferase
LLSLPVAFLLTKFAIPIAVRIGFVSNPNPIVETHKNPTAYGGGLAIGITIIIYLLLQSINFELGFRFVLILLPVITIGLLDDIFNFKPLVKFLSQIISSIPFLVYHISTSIPLILIFLFLILISQNAWNLVDVMDGLVSAISIIVFISAGILLLSVDGLEFYSALSFTIAFSSLGFRFFNKTPAKIFLGETGSLLLGSLFGFILMTVYFQDKIIAAFLFLLGIIPLFELFFLIIVRTKKGIPFYKGSPDHFSLRMLNNGLSVRDINKLVILFNSLYSVALIVIGLFAADFFALLICICVSLIILIAGGIYFYSFPAKEISR